MNVFVLYCDIKRLYKIELAEVSNLTAIHKINNYTFLTFHKAIFDVLWSDWKSLVYYLVILGILECIQRMSNGINIPFWNISSGNFRVGVIFWAGTFFEYLYVYVWIATEWEAISKFLIPIEDFNFGLSTRRGVLWISSLKSLLFLNFGPCVPYQCWSFKV